MSLNNQFTLHGMLTSAQSFYTLVQLMVRVSYVHHFNVTMVMFVPLTYYTVYDTVSSCLRATLDVIHKGAK